MVRIGQSFDIHKFKTGSGFKLGGVDISSDKAIIAHSDGDVLLHAIAESLLGALALGDLGQHYPDEHDTTENIDSAMILKEVYSTIKKEGYRLQNIDCMVYLEVPKLKPYMPLMQASIATILNVKKHQISIKATTFEGLGEIGRNEAIAASCVALLEKTTLRKL